MSSVVERLAMLLFVPADRPERFEKALGCGADAVVFDLEDAVAANGRASARSSLTAAREAILASPCPAVVRINPHGSTPYGEDLAAVSSLPLAAIMLSKVETVDAVTAATAATGLPVIALIESATGLEAARRIAAAGARLAFGSIDLAADLGCAHLREALLAARSELVLASRLAGRAGPLDGVTTSIKDAELVRSDAAHAAALGFGGKLLIHPSQLEPARAGFRPTSEELVWAARVLAAGADGRACAVDGAMVDAPVRLRAEQVRRRAEA